MAFFYPDTVTVPLPLDPELERWFSGNLSYDGSATNDSRLAPGSVGSGAAAGSAANRTGSGASGSAFSPAEHGPPPSDDRQAWIHASQGILYYAFPVEISLGIVGGLLSLVALSRHRKSSTDGYLIGFNVASVLLLACGGTLKLQDYTAHNNGYQRAYGCIKSANDWLWYSSLWILVVMTLERGLSLIQNHRHKTFCSAGQASAVIITIYGVCLVSALPEFWEYEPIETYDYVSNRTIVVSHLSTTADSPEYRILYFWYSVTITVFLPYPTMIAMLVLLVQGMRRTRQGRKRLLQKHAADPGPSAGGRRMAEELHLTRLYIVMILLYVLLSAPLTFLIIINGITPYWSWPVDNLYNGLYLIFEFVFYFYFAIQLPLYLSYYDKFRHSFVELCCCCCCCCDGCGHRRKHKHKEQAAKEDYLYKR